MSNIVSRRKLRVGQEHELLQKLEDAGLDNSTLADKIISSKGNKIAKLMVAVARSDDKSKIVVPNFMTPSNCDEETAVQLERWRKTYKHFFEIDPSFSGLKIPFVQGQRSRLVIELDGLKIEQILKSHISKQIKVWRWTESDLDVLVADNERTGLHAVRVLNSIDSDGNWKNKPAEFFWAECLSTETIKERLIHGLDVFLEKGEHLDQKTGTICSGSCGADGVVPGVDWGAGSVDVGRIDPSDLSDYWRVRRVVSV